MNAVKSLRTINVYLSKAGVIVKVGFWGPAFDGQALSAFVAVFVDIWNPII
jgi:hypothetical protein